MSKYESYLEDYEKTKREQYLAIPPDTDILFQHGMQNTPEHLETLIKFSAELGVKIYPIIVPGHYPNQKSHFGKHCDPGIDEIDEETWRLLEPQLNIEKKLILGGHSFGALFCQKILANPERAKYFKAGLFFAPASPIGFPGPTLALQIKTLGAHMRALIDRAMNNPRPFEIDPEIARWSLFGKEDNASIQKLLVMRVAEPNKRVFEYAFSKLPVFRYYLRKRISEIVLGQIEVPVYIFSGTKDKMVRAKGAKSIATAIGENADLTIFEGKRHGLIEDREVICQAIKIMRKNKLLPN